METTDSPGEAGRNYTPRPRKLHIVRPAASGRAHSFCCSSSPHKVLRPCRGPMCHCALRGRNTVISNDGILWICSANHRAPPCAVPATRKTQLKVGERLYPVRIFLFRSGREANGSPLSPVPPIKVVRSFSLNMTARQRAIDTKRERSWQKESFFPQMLHGSMPTGRLCGMPSRKRKTNGTLSLPVGSS